MSDDQPSDLEEKVQQFLRRNFPQIAMHGGTAAIEEIDKEEGVVWIRLGGTCSGCGISGMTLEALRQRLPQQIEEIDEVHASTLDGDMSGPSPTGPSRGGGIDDSPDAPF